MTDSALLRWSAASAVLFMLMLTACAQKPETAQPLATDKPVGTATLPATDPTPEPKPTTPAAVTCESIISDGTVSGFEELGWTVKESEFVIGDTTMGNGISCGWADWTRPSDSGQVFAWAPLDAEASGQLQSELIAQGWLREDGDEGIYITEDPDAALQTDDEGYGATYLFGDGWVSFADTKQSLILIERH